MLSVQTAGCAGMERLGVPTRTTLNAPPDDRGQYICRMHIDAAREFLGVCGDPVIRGSSNNHTQQQNHHNRRDQLNHLQHHHHQQHFVGNHRMATASSPATSPLIVAASGTNSISNNNTSALNNNSNHYNNNIPSMTNNSIGSNSITKSGSLDGTSLKYGGSGGGSSGDLSPSCNSTGSQCSVNSHSHDHHQHYQHQLQQQKTLCCPHHVPLPDSEWIPADQRPVQLRSSYQHSELTRSYIKPPPNKTVKDVPDRSSYNFYSSSTHSPNSGLHSLASTHSLASSSYSSSSSSSGSSSSSNSTGAQTKSKPNVITKFFYRKSSPKSPNNVAASSVTSLSAASSAASLPPCLYTALSSSSSSTSSLSLASSAVSLLSQASSAGSTSSTNLQASSLTATPLSTLPISTAATLKSTPCDYGPNVQQNSGIHISAGLVPSTQLLTTIGVSHPTATATFPHTAMPTGMEQRIPTPPLSVTVPINPAYQQQQKQHQQQLLLDCLVGDCASVSSTLQTIKSSSCSPTLSATTSNASRDDLQHMECQSGNITRNNSSSSMQSLTAATTTTTACNCQANNCKHCNNDVATNTTQAAVSSSSSSSSSSVSLS